MSNDALLSVSGLVKHFPMGGGLLSKPRAWVKAVDGVSFSLYRGESLGLVGESGCGKTTLGRLVLKLLDPTSGDIIFNGMNISDFSRTEMQPLRLKMQIIFQDPYSSLNPRMRVKSIVTEPLRGRVRFAKDRREQIAKEMFKKVGLGIEDLKKYPHEFSGGQRQRIGIARALCVKPQLIVADEPVSALDVSIQAQVINLMKNLRDEFNLSYLFISHDLGVVQRICERIAVMYLGMIVELASTEDFSRFPRHPYTRALLDAVPLPDPHHRKRLGILEGDVPNPISPPLGCRFHTRCGHVFDKCRIKQPPLVTAEENHYIACWLNNNRGVEGSG